MRQNDFHISATSDLDISPSDLETALPVTPDAGNLSSKFERCTIFRKLTVDMRQTDGQTDVQTDAV